MRLQDHNHVIRRWKKNGSDKLHCRFVAFLGVLLQNIEGWKFLSHVNSASKSNSYFLFMVSIMSSHIIHYACCKSNEFVRLLAWSYLRCQMTNGLSRTVYEELLYRGFWWAIEKRQLWQAYQNDQRWWSSVTSSITRKTHHKSLAASPSCQSRRRTPEL